MFFFQKQVCAPDQSHFSKDVTCALKGAGILLMLFHHLFSCSADLVEKYQVSSRLIPLDKLMTLSALSKICVAIFVFLSAYGMTLSAEKSGSSNTYIWKRYRKLALGFLMVYILSILTCFLRSDGLSVYLGEGKLKGGFYVLIDAAGLASFFGTPSYNETWWYMSVAILMIFAMPIFVRLYESFGLPIVLVAAMLPYLGLPLTSFTTYLFTMFLGIMAAKSRLIQWIMEQICPDLSHKSYFSKRCFFWPATVLLFLFLITFRYKCGHEYLTDGLLALVLSLQLFVLMDLRGIRLPILRFLGKYSMNMFLVHTLIFEYYFTDFIYSFQNWMLITLALLGASLLASLAIECLKRILRSSFSGHIG